MVRLTAEYIVKCNGHTKRKRDEPTTQYLKRITHLYMAERNIEAIDNLSACRNLTVLYLYDNKLNRTLNLGTAQNLTHLYLQNNSINKIEGIGHLYRLTKLYIGYNSISVIEGLQDLNILRELHVEHQLLPPGEKLLFEPRTLMGLSNCLCVLNISGNHMDTLNELSILCEVSHLIATDNLFNDFDDIVHTLRTWRNISRLELTGNPLCHKSKYRDHIIIMSQSLEILDGKQINQMERKFLLSWKASKEARKRSKQESRSNMDLPPLQHFVHHPAPPPHYTMGGFPGGRKRFEAILAKSRSLPASAMPVNENGRLQQYSSPVVRQPPPELIGDMGNKSISDLATIKSERQMTPHPNLTRYTRSKTLHSNISDFTSQRRMNDEGAKTRNGFSSAKRVNPLNSISQQKFIQRSGFTGHMPRVSKLTDASFDRDRMEDMSPYSAQTNGILIRTDGSGKAINNSAHYMSSKFGKPMFPVGRQEVNGGDIHLDSVEIMAPLPSPRMDGEGRQRNVTPRQIVVSP